MECGRAQAKVGLITAQATGVFNGNIYFIGGGVVPFATSPRTRGARARLNLSRFRKGRSVATRELGSTLTWLAVAFGGQIGLFNGGRSRRFVWPPIRGAFVPSGPFVVATLLLLQ